MVKFLLRSAVSALALSAAALTGAAQAQTAAPLPPPIPAPTDAAKAYPGVIDLEVDISDVARGVFKVKQRVPLAGAGPVTLLLPKWLPGNHAPRGQIEKIAGLRFRANGQTLPWRRDPVEVYAFIVEPPAGATVLEVEFEHLSPLTPAQGRVVAAPKMANLQWNNTLLYPAGYFASQIRFKPKVKLPQGWGYALGLETEARAGDEVTFVQTDLETLVDSPMFAGAHHKSIDLAPGAAVPVRLNLFGDEAKQIEATEEQIQKHKNLVQEAYHVFGPGHFDRYDFLLAMSATMGGIGLEHHRSSENAAGKDYFLKWDTQVNARDLLPHELTHSWNGKWRRPADLWVANYEVPMRDSLLWVYEGQTSYWGEVLAARSGLWSLQEALDSLALTAATYAEGRPGKAWRPLVDTTNEPILSARRPQPWRPYIRPEDYYAEGALIWLDADTLIRERSGGKRSLDDFSRAFFSGGKAGDRTPSLYTFEDVVAALNAVEPFDWAGFLRQRVLQVAPKAPLDGLERGGWRLVFTDKPTDTAKKLSGEAPGGDFLYSLGLRTGRTGEIVDVLWDGLAFRENLTTNSKIIAVNGRTYSVEALEEAITAGKDGAAIELLVQDGERIRPVRFDYRGGLRHPRLERIEGTPDRLSALFAPQVTAKSQAKPKAKSKR
jgi:predicted metalloprotease with PDZ domain